jgi:hypothetical protein
MSLTRSAVLGVDQRLTIRILDARMWRTLSFVRVAKIQVRDLGIPSLGPE